ncbi:MULTISPECIES: EAL domain-containing protein [unclassified Sphingomonas]|uniref:putative bifunctional diguanylate cyclase/phosphodiesterase n=1 Tax=unclassified Sphingomonas TaxID=196159 RepID=UPI0025D9BDBA|nr:MULTISPECIES: EAL domain-containing protein [unclassified Sphingomonas]
MDEGSHGDALEQHRGLGGSLLRLQNAILGSIAKGDRLASTCTQLCVEVEALLPDVICSVLLVDDEGRLHPLAGPSLPNAYSAALDGTLIGPSSGSCGSTAYFGTEVAVEDIATDPRWEQYRHIALSHGLRACWSSPIINAAGTTVATFAIYHREPTMPTEAEREVVQNCVHLCLIAIDRHHRLVEHERRAFTDALTGLPNRAAFNAALLDLDCRQVGGWALFALDLDNLKVVNDTFGHAAGDGLLRAASRCVEKAAFPDRAFRIGGDELAVVVQSPDALRDLEGAAGKILQALMSPVDCGGQIIVPRATIGGAVQSHDAPSVDRVRQNADFALYHAKETGRGGFVRYWPGLGSSMTQRLSAIRDVGAALREDRIEAFYQPIFRLDTREIVGLEALCRMRIGDGIVAASAFHEAMSDVYVATAITARMMQMVAADIRGWLDMGIPIQHVGINVSSADLSGGSVDRVLTDAFAQVGVPLEHVILEVTETVYMGDGDQLIQAAIQSLRGKGIKVALDDFGTGFASLTHLLTVPVDIIKIDKTFVDHLAVDSVSMTIVEGLIRIAERMNIRIVAEGIESEEQAGLLAAAGCILGQGFLVSPALPRQQTTALLLSRAQRPEGAATGVPAANTARMATRGLG